MPRASHWLVCRRYLSAESMAPLDAVQDEDYDREKNNREEVMALNAGRAMSLTDELALHH